MTMTPEQVSHLLTKKGVMPSRELRQKMADAVDARLTQPAQSVDVEKVREVITELNSFPASDKQIRWANKLVAALQDKTP